MTRRLFYIIAILAMAVPVVLWAISIAARIQ
jgi:hypothetical protein